jgi:hypothetical protein
MRNRPRAAVIEASGSRTLCPRSRIRVGYEPQVRSPAEQGDARDAARRERRLRLSRWYGIGSHPIRFLIRSASSIVAVRHACDHRVNWMNPWVRSGLCT